MSQPQLAVAAGVPVSTLRGWEQDRREPMLMAAVKLARALGVSLDELAGVEAAGKPRPAAPAEESEPDKKGGRRGRKGGGKPKRA